MPTFNEFSAAFFLPLILEKVSFDPYDFWITRLSINKIVFETLCIEVPKIEDLHISAKIE